MLASCVDVAADLSDASEQLRRFQSGRIDINVEQGLPFWGILTQLCSEFVDCRPGPVAVKLSKARSDPWRDFIQRKLSSQVFFVSDAVETSKLFAGLCVESGRKPLTVAEVSRCQAWLEPSGCLMVVNQFHQLQVPRPLGDFICIPCKRGRSLVNHSWVQRGAALRRVRFWEALPLSTEDVSAYYQLSLQLLGRSNRAVHLRMESIIWMLTPHAQFPEMDMRHLLDAQERASSTLRSMRALCPAHWPGAWDAPSPSMSLLCEAVNRSAFTIRFYEKAAHDVLDMFEAWWLRRRGASPADARVHNRGVLCVPPRMLTEILDRLRAMPGIESIPWPRNYRSRFPESLEAWSRGSELAMRCRAYLQCLRASSAHGARRLYAEDILRSACVEYLEEIRVLLIDHESLCEVWELLDEKPPTDVFCPWPMLQLSHSWTSSIFHFPYRPNTIEGKLLTLLGLCVY